MRGGTEPAEGVPWATSLVLGSCVVDSPVAVGDCMLAPGAPGADASERERSARDIWATSTDGEGFAAFLGSGGGAGGWRGGLERGFCVGREGCLTPCAFFALSAYERTGGWAVVGVGETIDLLVNDSR